MCGICGIVRSNSPVTKEEIILMTDSLQHRGPDDSGTYCSDNVGLGHRRLSIIDVSRRGHQPMHSRKRAVTIVYNGELYNYQTIRAGLLKRGYQFGSNSDTEVILYSYIEYGTQCASMFDGIFSFAIYSALDKSIHLFRDRHGIKPLYFFVAKNTIAFSSEIKALHCIPDIPISISDSAVSEFFLYRSISGNNTLYSNIHELPPGNSLLVNCLDMSFTVNSYLPKSRCNSVIQPSPRLISSLIEHSVQMQMVSDVTVGTMCSGGVDSSLITYYASLYNNKPLHTFSVGFPSSKHDETRYAAYVAEKFKTKHSLLQAKPDDIINNLQYLTYINDEPIAHYNSIYMYKIAQAAYSKNVKVLLSGEGADELFSGYRRSVNIHSIESFLKYNFLPNKLTASASSKFKKPAIIKMLNQYYKNPPDEFIALLLTFNRIGHAQYLFGDQQIAEIVTKRAAQLSAFGLTTLSEKLRMYEITAYLPVLLMRQDKMTMAASVEARVPFLGNGISQYAMRCTAKSLVQGRSGKWPLKQIAAEKIGTYITRRRKIGFHVPFGTWLRSDDNLFNFTTDWLINKQAKYTRYIPFDYIDNALRHHMNGENRTEILWTVLCMEIWLNNLSERRPIVI